MGKEYILGWIVYKRLGKGACYTEVVVRPARQNSAKGGCLLEDRKMKKNKFSLNLKSIIFVKDKPRFYALVAFIFVLGFLLGASIVDWHYKAEFDDMVAICRQLADKGQWVAPAGEFNFTYKVGAISGS